MNKHSIDNLSKLSCPFALDMNKVEWNNVEKVISVDDIERSIIVKMKNEDIFLVNIKKSIYDSIHKSGEDHAIEMEEEKFDSIT